MNLDKIREALEKLPVGVIISVFVAYLAYDLYSFQFDPSSPLLMKRRDLGAATEENKRLDGQLKEAQLFVKNLELKKTELRRLAMELEELKSSISEKLDIPAFMKRANTEAKKVGFTVLSIKPNGSQDKEFYSEYAFNINFRGAFIQLLAYFQRLSNIQELVKVEDFNMHTLGSNRARYVQLEGMLEVKTYKYIGSKADTIGVPEANQNGNSSSSNPPDSNPAEPKPGGGT